MSFQIEYIVHYLLSINKYIPLKKSLYKLFKFNSNKVLTLYNLIKFNLIK